MPGKRLITPKDLNVIREGYSIPSSIVLSASAAHETPRDNRSGYLCLNEYMLGAGVRIPFDFGVAEAFWAFNVPPACVVPHSWKVIQTIAWYYEYRGCSADWYLWREPLIRWLSRGWEMRFFFVWLTSEGDIWGVPERWEEPLLDPIPRSLLSLPASQRWALMYFRGTTLRWHSSREEFFHWCELAPFALIEEGERRTLKRVRPSEEEGNLADFDSSVKRAFGSLPSGQSTPATELEGMTPPSVVVQLIEELEASRAVVARLQSMLRGDVVRPSAVAEYLRRDAYRRRMEFEQAYHSRSGYIRALSDVATLYPEMELSSLYQFSVVVIYDSLFCSYLAPGSPMLADSRRWVEGRLWRLVPLILSMGVALVGGFPVFG
ncbi:hypothetical protein ACLOJK_022856 [Asimina triloba]